MRPGYEAVLLASIEPKRGYKAWWGLVALPPPRKAHEGDATPGRGLMVLEEPWGGCPVLLPVLQGEAGSSLSGGPWGLRACEAMAEHRQWVTSLWDSVVLSAVLWCPQCWWRARLWEGLLKNCSTQQLCLVGSDKERQWHRA